LGLHNGEPERYEPLGPWLVGCHEPR